MNKRNRKPRNREMYRAILTLKTEEELMAFMDDLCTVSELQAMEQRFQVAVLLSDGMIYNDILDQTGASSATISRVNRSLQYGNDGYAVAFERMKRQDAGEEI
ncbi:MAG: TrpR-like protein [Oscillospiraceae bacterium]|nr:TrpR-like protein [Oscillospiraceae bacterium]